MTFRHRYSATSTQHLLSSGDFDAIEDICVEWEQHRRGCTPGYGEIINLALHRMRQDLDTSSGEVMKDLRREIGYRQWCARTASV